MTHVIGVLLTMIYLFELNVFMFYDTASRDASLDSDGMWVSWSTPWLSLPYHK